VIGGSQKAISAPSGLTIVSVSADAKEVMKNRKNPIVGFYCNLTIWENYYKEKWFPYTMPISDIIGLATAVDNILEEGINNVLLRHERIAYATKEAFKEYGLKLYLEKGYSNTVTVVEIPKEIGAKNLTNKLLKDYNLILVTSLGEYADKVIRIGHMGENARLEKIIPVLNFIDEALGELGYECNKSLVNLFNKHYK
ncbi:MAG: pyridoxal-phosphate-dependent aminotransferase family protein, partial [Peptostreptococcaceae bacterium]